VDKSAKKNRKEQAGNREKHRLDKPSAKKRWGLSKQVKKKRRRRGQTTGRRKRYQTSREQAAHKNRGIRMAVSKPPEEQRDRTKK